ncbi:MAG: Trypsin domain protein [Myxococcaceae bacterium]|nr:Trypsin domain protein [Myxococcaceae bacterium]
MSRSPRRLLVLARVMMVAGLAACQDEDLAAHGAGASQLGEIREPIIYGNDDRLEVYQHPDPVLRGLAQSSVVALIPIERFVEDTSGDLQHLAPTLATAFHVCADQRFAAEPTAADCSGVLLDDDLVLTAAHCFETDSDCARYAFMFDYFVRSDRRFEDVGWGDIYGCRRVVARTLDPAGSTPRVDYAIVQLDRPAVGRTPVTVRTSPLIVGEEAAVIGCPSGLPFKIDSGGRVLQSRASVQDFFLLDSDTFQGSSGSGVFDSEGQLIGTLVRGGDDYGKGLDGGCVVPEVVTKFEPDAGAVLKLAPDGGMLDVNAEEATYVTRAIDGLCSAGWPSERLCKTAARCGDGFCSLGETRSDCPADCACVSADCAGGDSDKAGSAGARNKSRHDSGGCSASSQGERVAPPYLAWLALVALSLASRRRRHARS